MKTLRAASLAGLLAAWPLGLPAQTHSQTERQPPISIAQVNDAFLRSQDDVTAVTQVVLRERQARDSGWWDRMLASYWPDSRVDLTWYHGDGPGFVYASRALAERGVRGKHRLLAPIADIKGNRAHVEVGSRNWSQSTIGGKVVNLYADMRLNYLLEKRGGDWKIVSLNPIYEHSELDPDVPGETLTIPAAELARYRPSYAALSWSLTRKGLTMAQDEIGIDRPAGVNAYYASVRKWLGE